MLRGPSWSEREVHAIVADYFSMLEKELRGIAYSKTEHRRALQPLLTNRSDASIEKKHQNISAILIEAAFPYIRGYKPLSQYQGLLAEVVLDHLDDDMNLTQLALHYAQATVSPQRPANVLGLMTPPPVLESAKSALSDAIRRRYARRVDYLALEAQNRTLGANGEELVVSYERARLSSFGLDTLAGMVEHVAATRGDGLGYDVLSFTADARERFIEVKTTRLGPLTPFYVTANELSFSGEHESAYSLYRVYDFASNPRLFSLDGRVDQTCRVSPAQYVAVPR